jgi:hypothetical protein
MFGFGRVKPFSYRICIVKGKSAILVATHHHVTMTSSGRIVTSYPLVQVAFWSIAYHAVSENLQANRSFRLPVFSHL